jgi:CRP/FNR family transcriptional regulator, anaerobic regulatory protein
MVSHSTSTLAAPGALSPTQAATVISLHELGAHCASCSMRGLCLSAGLGPDAMRRLDQIVSTRTRVKKRDMLYRPGDRFTALYAIRLGTFKTLLLAEDGREQITGYHMSGDIVGLDGISADQHACQAIALEDSEVCVLPFNRLDALAHDEPLLRHNLYRFISKDICRDQDMMLLLGSRSAEERLALFLLNLAGRYQLRGYSSSEFVLRMTREEIASYLGLKLETVSRLFSHLQEEGLIQVQGRAVKLLDLAALKRLVGQAG